MEFLLLFPTIVTTIFSFYVFLLYIINKKNAKKVTYRKPPQPKGAWPVIGHLHLLGGSEFPHTVLSKMAKNYGPIFTIKLGFHQVLVVNNAVLAREYLLENDKAFSSRPKTLVLGYNRAMFGIAPYGDYWRKVRKMVMFEVLSERKVKMLEHLRVLQLRASIKSIYDGWLKNKESGDSDMVKVDMSQWFGELILNILVRMISGKRFCPNDAVCFIGVIRKTFELTGAFVVSDFIPYLKFLDLGGYIKRMKNTRKELDEVIDGWLEEHNIKRESAAQHEGEQVTLSILQGATETVFPGFDHYTTIKATCLQIILGGTDTTSATFTWALSLLLNNPRAFETARAEIDKVVGRERLVEESDMKNLVYLEAVIKETLRLYPPGPLGVPRESIEDCVVGGYSIPKGTRLLVNISNIQRDPNTWSNPQEFQPERFLTIHKDVDAKGNHFDLIPFGAGRRKCPGATLALHSLHITLASLIQQFEIQKPSNEPLDMSESFGLSISKEKPLEVLLSPRLSLDMYDIGELFISFKVFMLSTQLSPFIF